MNSKQANLINDVHLHQSLVKEQEKKGLSINAETLCKSKYLVYTVKTVRVSLGQVSDNNYLEAVHRKATSI